MASLQVAGPNVLCQRALQVASLNVVGLSGVVQPPAAGFAGVCEQLPMASLQVVGPHVAGVCEQPPAASLQAAGQLELGLVGAFGQPPMVSLQAVGPHVSGFCCYPCYPVMLLCVRRQG